MPLERIQEVCLLVVGQCSDLILMCSLWLLLFVTLVYHNPLPYFEHLAKYSIGSFVIQKPGNLFVEQEKYLTAHAAHAKSRSAPFSRSHGA